MPKRKRSQDIDIDDEENENSANVVEENETNTTVQHDAKRKFQLPFISTDTSSTSDTSTTINCLSNDNEISTAATSTSSQFSTSELSPLLPSTERKTVSDQQGDGGGGEQQNGDIGGGGGRERTAATSAMKTTTTTSVESPPKKRVRFDGVTVYYFHRSQGFSCVPTTGGNTLGMSGRHHTVRKLTLNEHEVEQKFEKRRHLSSWHLWRQQQQQQQQQHYVGMNGNNNDGMETTGQTSPFYSSVVATGTDHNHVMPSYFHNGTQGVSSSTNNFDGNLIFNGVGGGLEAMEDDEEDEEEEDEDEDEEDEDEDEEDEDEDGEELEDEEKEENTRQQQAVEEFQTSQQQQRQQIMETNANCGGEANLSQLQTAAAGTTTNPCAYVTTTQAQTTETVNNGSTYSIQLEQQQRPKSNLVSNNRPVAIAKSQVPLLEENFLQPLGSRERRSLLKEAGVQVDAKEKGDCHNIRISRQVCGCDCRGQCIAETCACARDNIKCQVDRPSFPCGCTKQGCMNPRGRVEFNPLRVRTHYMHTMMRLKMENRRQQELPSPRHVRFGDEDTYADFRDGDESGRQTQSATNFPAFHTLFSCSNSAAPTQATTICNDRSYWRLDANAAAASSIDHQSTNGSTNAVVNMHQQSVAKNGYHVQPTSTWPCVYRSEEVGADAAHRQQQAYCTSMGLDPNTNNHHGEENTTTTTNGCFEEKIIYDNCPPRRLCAVAEETTANEMTMYSLASLYSHQPQRHYGHNNANNGNVDHRNHSHLYNGTTTSHDSTSSFQEFSSNSYPNYVSTSFTPVIYDGTETTSTNGIGNHKIDGREKIDGKMTNGHHGLDEMATNGFDICQQRQSPSNSGSTHIGDLHNNNADSSDSSDSGCALPSSPPPPELAAVLKKSICETALA